MKAAAGALARITSASNKRCKKVFDAKRGNNCLRNVLTDTDDEIGLKGAVVVQDRINSCKETAEEVIETQVMGVRQALVLKANLDSGMAEPGKVQQQIKTGAEAPLAEAHKHGIRRTQREAAGAEEAEELEQEPPGARASSGESVQQRGPPGAREQGTRAAEVEGF